MKIKSVIIDLAIGSDVVSLHPCECSAYGRENDYSPKF